MTSQRSDFRIVKWSFLLIPLFIPLLFLQFVAPVSIYFDANRLKDDTDTGWNPDPTLYAAATVFAPLIGAYYWYKREQHLPSTSNTDWAWIIGPGVSLLVYLGLPIVTFVTGTLDALQFVGLTYLAWLVTPAAYVTDVESLAALDGDWNPNPATWGVTALLLPFIPVVNWILPGYYLAKRYQAYGLEPGAEV